jgi:hypothetical protein
MAELHALLDFENVQTSLIELGVLAPGFTKVWLFHGPRELKRAEKLEAADNRITLVARSAEGPNSLDFHLTFYLGYVAAKHPEARMVVVSNDKDYDPMIAHARILGFTVERVGRTVVPSKSAKPAAAKKPVPAAKAAPAKKATPAKAPVVKKAAAKKVAVKKTPAKKVAAKKVKTTKPQVAKVASQPKAVPAASKELNRIKSSLAKMGDRVPHKLKSFQRLVGNLLGKGATTEQIDLVTKKLEKAGVIRIAGDLVSYL